MYVCRYCLIHSLSLSHLLTWPLEGYYLIKGSHPSYWQHLQYIPRNMHTVFALLCFVVVIHWLIFPYPSGLLHWHCGNLTIAPVPAKQPWWIWIKTSCEFIMNDCITTTKQSTTKPCAYFLGYTVTVLPGNTKQHYPGQSASTSFYWQFDTHHCTPAILGDLPLCTHFRLAPTCHHSQCSHQVTIH